MAGPAAAFIAVAAIQAVGSILSGFSRASDLEKEAELLEKQRRQELLVAEREKWASEQDWNKRIGEAKVASAASGVAASSGATLQTLEEAEFLKLEEISAISRQAAFQSQQRLEVASSMRQQAGMSRILGFVGAGASGADAYARNKGREKPSQPTKLRE
jgi:hypothetical protein